MRKQLVVPELAENVHAADLAELAIKPGDTVTPGQTVATLETDKAAMDLPAEFGGKVIEVLAKAGAKISVGDPIAILEVEDGDAQAAPESGSAAPAAKRADDPAPARQTAAPRDDRAATGTKAADPAAPAAREPAGAVPGHASPAIRQYARDLGVDPGAVAPSGRKGRVTREDLHRYVRDALAGGGGGGLQPLPELDFAQWGPVEEVTLSRVRQLTGENLGRSWPRVPQVTQHDEADITALEDFRRAHADQAEARGAKLTPVAFVLKASAAALREFPDFNASLHPDGRTLIRKRYLHIGVAVDTPAGLVVPVVRDVDRKGILDLARELADLSGRARERKLTPDEMRGGCFTISSLGGIGGTAFTPVVNWPEVAILGVSRAALRPVWQGDAFAPRLVLPLSLSYDHRVIDGAAAVRFTRRLCALLEDLRELLL
jgi:pyruvate dehydrogenase E2 component (dihydrolipoamide acetyltransferase)